jgi:hypothetical protein
MKKTHKKLTLNRDTVRSLTAPALGQAVGAAIGTRQSCSCYVTCASCVSCDPTCNSCPTHCGQWYC